MTEIVAGRSTLPVRLRAGADAAMDLLLHPEHYFESLLRRASGRIPWLVIWICGAANVIDNLDFRLLTGQVAVNSPALLNWFVLWGSVFIGGFIFGSVGFLLLTAFGSYQAYHMT